MPIQGRKRLIFLLLGKILPVVTEIKATVQMFTIVPGTLQFIKVTVDLQGCLPKNHSYARRLYYKHRKVYIIVKLIKCRIRRNNSFYDLI